MVQHPEAGGRRGLALVQRLLEGLQGPDPAHQLPTALVVILNQQAQMAAEGSLEDKEPLAHRHRHKEVVVGVVGVKNQGGLPHLPVGAAHGPGGVDHLQKVFVGGLLHLL